MNKNLIVLAAALGAGFSAVADNSNVKVCVYDPEQVMSQSKELGRLIGEIDKKYQAQFEALKKEEDTLRDDAAKFQAKASVMKPAALEEGKKDLERRTRDLNTKAERVFEDHRNERQKIGINFVRVLEEGVGQFAQANGYDLVLPKSPGVFALARADQTTALVAHMNKKFDESGKKVGAPAPLTVAKK